MLTAGTGGDSPDLRFAGSPSLRLRRKEGWGKINATTIILNPLYGKAIERVGQRSGAGVSLPRSNICQVNH